MRIVLDTNCLLVALLKQSHHRWLWDGFRQGKFTLCYSTEILQEYEEILTRFYSQEFADFAVETLLSSPNIIQTIPYYRWNLITADPDDNKFVDCALNVNADYVVTNDKHFNVLKDIDFPKIEVIDIETFKKIIMR